MCPPTSAGGNTTCALPQADLTGNASMEVDHVRSGTLLTRARLRLSTRRCRACGERYQHPYPYRPVCKTKKGDRDVPKGEGTFAAGAF